MNGDSVLLGSSGLDLTNRVLSEILDLRNWMLGTYDTISPFVLHEYDSEIRTLFFELRDEALDPTPPTMLNTDGDLIQFHNLIFELNCGFEEAVEILAPLAFEDGVKGLLNDATAAENYGGAPKKSLEIPWLKAGNNVHSRWEHTAHGHIWVEDGLMNIEVNSDERAEEIKGIIEERFGKKARFVGSKAVDFDKKLEEMNISVKGKEIDKSRTEREALLEIPEIREKIEEMAGNCLKGFCWGLRVGKGFLGMLMMSSSLMSNGFERSWGFENPTPYY